MTIKLSQKFFSVNFPLFKLNSSLKLEGMLILMLIPRAHKFYKFAKAKQF